MQLFDSKVTCSFIQQEKQWLLTIEPVTTFNTFEWISANKSIIEKYLVKYGGILLRNFGIYSVSEFNKLAQIICPNLLDYVYRSTPRTKLGGKVYTATEYSADRSIPFHNENSYSKSWPEKILFFSVIVAQEGGETPIASSSNVYNKIDPFVRDKFEKNGILYVRNYTQGIDLSWQEVFQTDNKEEVEKFCKEHDIECQWNDKGPELTTKQICQASIIHPVSKVNSWFNQAHLFHSSALTASEKATLIEMLGHEEYLPRNTFYGNGDHIELEVLEHIKEVYNKEKIKFKWHKGDIMILDNLLSAHSREPYKGERKIAVAMA